MTMRSLVGSFQIVFVVYFAGLHGVYLLLNILAMGSVSRHMRARAADPLGGGLSPLEPPVSVLVPAFNEESTIEWSVRALLQLSYSQYEILVINDGSTDGTLQRLIEAFDLRPYPEACRLRLASEPVRTVYHSARHAQLRVIDKVNGGKADSLNAGVNLARYPLVCSVDADSILQRDSLQRVARPFLEDPTTVAVGGTVLVANGCRMKEGFVEEVDIPRSKLALLQSVEYLRAFLFGRLGWARLNSVLVISGAFGLFHKETLVRVGGYRKGTLGEDMELVVRLHDQLRREGTPYRITFVPDPICWTEAPETLRSLGRQRIRWHRGLLESLAHNRRLLFARRSGAAGWLAYPFLLLFEALGPLVELAGYVFMAAAWSSGLISTPALIAFLLLAVGLGTLLSAGAVLLEEISFRVYPRPRHLVALLAAGVMENVGYRQLNALWRVVALFQWATRRGSSWGTMERRATFGNEGACARHERVVIQGRRRRPIPPQPFPALALDFETEPEIGSV